MELFKTVSYLTDFLNMDPEENLLLLFLWCYCRQDQWLFRKRCTGHTERWCTSPRCGPVSVLFFLPLPYYYHQFTSFHLKLAEYYKARFDSVHAKKHLLFSESVECGNDIQFRKQKVMWVSQFICILRVENSLFPTWSDHFNPEIST